MKATVLAGERTASPKTYAQYKQDRDLLAAKAAEGSQLIFLELLFIFATVMLVAQWHFEPSAEIKALHAPALFLQISGAALVLAAAVVQGIQLRKAQQFLLSPAGKDMEDYAQLDAACVTMTKKVDNLQWKMTCAIGCAVFLAGAIAQAAA